MITLSEIPVKDLLCPPILFTADNGKRGTYYLWKRTEREDDVKVTRVYWYALGNSGVEEDVPDATASARRWIRDGMRGYKKHE